jgi:GNAT superfamily N-acetyltransferase
MSKFAGISLAEYEVRRATLGDLPAMRTFFAAAYGARSIFLDDDFVRWFLGNNRELLSMIALAPSGEVVGHYGAVRTTALLDGARVSMLWGVNAFTLPDYRGVGLGEKLAAPWYRAADVFGVIGFSPATAAFYERCGFQLFSRRRFVRQARVLDERAFDLLVDLGIDVDHAREMLPVIASTRQPTRAISRELTGDLEPAAPDVALTTLRDREYVDWRFRNQRWLSYDVLTINDAKRTRAYVATRRTRLEPTAHHAVRIVDACGEPEAIADLVSAVVATARARGDTWVDFAATRVLEGLEGFATLVDDDTALLPSVTSPMQHRPNTEFVGLYSTTRATRLSQLAFDDVYFTRADSDRDRAARLPEGA